MDLEDGSRSFGWLISPLEDGFRTFDFTMRVMPLKMIALLDNLGLKSRFAFHN